MAMVRYSGSYNVSEHRLIRGTSFLTPMLQHISHFRAKWSYMIWCEFIAGVYGNDEDEAQKNHHREDMQVCTENTFDAAEVRNGKLRGSGRCAVVLRAPVAKTRSEARRVPPTV